MTLNVPDLRKGLRRTTDQYIPQEVSVDRRKTRDRRTVAGEPEDIKNIKKVRRVWLTPKSKTLLEDLFLLDEK